LRLGASTTIGQYVLATVLAAFHKKFSDIQIKLITDNTEHIENALKDNDIDLGIIEGRSKNTSIKYSEFIKDEIVLVSSVNNQFARKEIIQPNDLKNISLLMREPGSGTLEVIIHALKKAGLTLRDLKIEMQLAGTESIKSYLSHSNCMAFLSIHSILNQLKKNEFRIIDIKGMNIERYFYSIQLHGQLETLPELFMKFARNHNFR